MGQSLRNGIFTVVNLLNNLLASCSLRNFNFLLLHTENFDKSIILSFLVFKTFVFSTFWVFFYSSNNKITLLYI